jgi:hypothetical protein
MQKHGRGKCDQCAAEREADAGELESNTQGAACQLLGSGRYRVTPRAAWGG